MRNTLSTGQELALPVAKGLNRPMMRVRLVLSALGTAARNENVRRVELAWGAAIAAEWAHFVALGVFAYEHGGASAVGLAGLVRLLPAAVIAPFAASLGDRFRRERFLQAMLVAGAAALAGSAAAAFADSMTLVLVFAAVIGVSLDAGPAGAAGAAAVARANARGADRCERRDLDRRRRRRSCGARARRRPRLAHERRRRLPRRRRSPTAGGRPARARKG